MKESQRQKQKIQTRKYLIEVATNEFAKSGFSSTRTSDIAVAAKVSHGTIFVHFPTKENLLDEVIEEFGMNITSRLHELINENCGLKEALKAHLKGIEEYEIFYPEQQSENAVVDR